MLSKFGSIRGGPRETGFLDEGLEFITITVACFLPQDNLCCEIPQRSTQRPFVSGHADPSEQIIKLGLDIDRKLMKNLTGRCDKLLASSAQACEAENE
jgi:hypothetical protein